MEAVEIIVYLGVALIIGFLVLGFINDWDFLQGVNLFKKLSTDSEELKFEKVNKIEFASRLNSFNTMCKSSEISELRLHINDQGQINKTGLFDTYKELDWCKSIQSADNDCGSREDIIMQTISIPRVVTLRCINKTTEVS